MRFWDPSGPEVEAADASPWDGPGAGAFRPLTTRVMARVAIAGGVLYLFAGISGSGALASSASSLETYRIMIVAAALVVCAVFGAAISLLPVLVQPAVLRRVFPLATLPALFVPRS